MSLVNNLVPGYVSRGRQEKQSSPYDLLTLLLNSGNLVLSFFLGLVLFWNLSILLMNVINLRFSE